MSTVLGQLVLMLGEALCIASVLLGLLRARATLGLAPIFMVLGVLFHLAGFLAGTLYVRFTPLLVMSPGSIVLFPANILVVLFAYVQGDAYDARKVIYGLFAANVVTVLLGGFIALHLQSPATLNPFQLSPTMFVGNPRIALVGASVLFADTLLIVVVYEWLRRKLRGAQLLPIWLSTLVVLTFDTLLFVTGSFVETPAYTSILVSGLLGKSLVGSLYALLLYAYVRVIEQPAASSDDSRPLGDVLQVLTYRERYEALRAEARKDALTHVNNRAYFDQVLKHQLTRSATQAQCLALLMIDVDHFKVINDRAGHIEGDRVLRAVAAALSASVRGSDIVCRFGGEEFAILLPDTALAQAEQLARRILGRVARECGWGPSDLKGEPVTVTIGVAASNEAAATEGLVRLADERLYVGKRAGRNRVVGERITTAADSVPPSRSAQQQ